MDPAAAAQLEPHQNPHQFTDTHSKERLTITFKSPQASKAAHASSSLSPCCVCVTAPNTLATPHSSAVPELVPFPFNPPSSLSSSTALCQACYCTVYQLLPLPCDEAWSSASFTVDQVQARHQLASTTSQSYLSICPISPSSTHNNLGCFRTQIGITRPGNISNVDVTTDPAIWRSICIGLPTTTHWLEYSITSIDRGRRSILDGRSRGRGGGGGEGGGGEGGGGERAPACTNTRFLWHTTIPYITKA